MKIQSASQQSHCGAGHAEGAGAMAPQVTLDELIDRFEVILLDSDGVLVRGPVAGPVTPRGLSIICLSQDFQDLRMNRIGVTRLDDALALTLSQRERE